MFNAIEHVRLNKDSYIFNFNYFNYANLPDVEAITKGA